MRDHGRAYAFVRLGPVLVVLAMLVMLASCAEPTATGRCTGSNPAVQRYYGKEQYAVTNPVGADGAVYVDYASTPDPANVHHRVAAFRASDGTLLWQVADPMTPGTRVLELAGNMLLLSNGVALVALRTHDGSLLWQAPIGVAATEVVQEGVLYTWAVVNGQGGLCAVRLADAHVLWLMTPPDKPVYFSVPTIYYQGSFGPMVSGGVVYFGKLDGSITAVRASDGALLWQVDVVPLPHGDLPTQAMPLAAGGGVLYVQGETDEQLTDVLVLRTRDGAVMGSLHLQSDGTGASGTPGISGTPGSASAPEYFYDPVWVGGMFYIGVIRREPDASTGTLTYTLETVDGKRLWQIPWQGTPVLVQGTQAHLFAQDGDLVFIGDTLSLDGFVGAGEVMAVQLAGGKVRWQQQFLGSLAGSLVAVGGGYVFGSHTGNVVPRPCSTPTANPTPTVQVLDETDGHVLWTRNLLTLDQAG